MKTAKLHKTAAALMLLALLILAPFAAQKVYAYLEECPPHEWILVDNIEPSCEMEGYRYYICVKCGESREETSPKLPHVLGDYVTTTPATCTSTGEAVAICQNCGQRQFVSLPVTDHTYGYWWTSLEPGCTSGGQRMRVCQVCGHEETEYLYPNGHSYGAWTTLQEATCTSYGSRTRTCYVCGDVQTESTPLAAHAYGPWNVTVEPTDRSAGTRMHACQVCGHEESESFDPEGTLRRGDRGDRVSALQTALNEHGCSAGAADGIFGQMTESAVRQFEETSGLPSDGVAWPAVQTLLFAVPEKAEDIIEPGLLSGHLRNGKIPAPSDGGYSMSLKISVACTCDAVYVPVGCFLEFDITINNRDVYGRTLSSVRLYATGHNSREGIGYLDLLASCGDLGPGETTEPIHVVYTVTEEDFDIGQLYLRWMAIGETPDGEMVVSNESEHGFIAWWQKVNPRFEGRDGTILLDMVQTSPVKAGYELGSDGLSEEITYQATVQNGSQEPLHFSCLRVYPSPTDIEGAFPVHLDEPIVIPPGGSTVQDVSFRVSADDILPGTEAEGLLGQAAPAFQAYADDSEVPNLRIASSKRVSFTYNLVPAGDGDGEGALDVFLAPESKSILTAGYMVGEEVVYAIEVTNQTDVVIQEVEVSDPLLGSNEDSFVAMIPEIAPKETETVYASYTVTPEDVTRTYIDNKVSASFVPGGSSSRKISWSNEVRVNTVPDEPAASLVLSLEATSSPANGQYYVEGEEISYRLEVGNQGNIPIDEDIRIYVALSPNGLDPYDTISGLSYSEAVDYYPTYTVKAGDAATGLVWNYAYAAYPGGGGEDILTFSNQLRLPAGPISPDSPYYDPTSPIPAWNGTWGGSESPESGNPSGGKKLPDEPGNPEPGNLPGGQEPSSGSGGQEPSSAPGGQEASGDTAQADYQLHLEVFQLQPASEFVSINDYGYCVDLNYLAKLTNTGNRPILYRITELWEGDPSSPKVSRETDWDTGVIIAPGETLTYYMMPFLSKNSIIPGSASERLSGLIPVTFIAYGHSAETGEAICTSNPVSLTYKVVSPGMEWADTINEAPAWTETGSITVTLDVPKEALLGEYYARNEAVTFTGRVTNRSDSALSDIELTDPLMGTNEDMTLDVIPVLGAGETYDFAYTYHITDADLSAMWSDHSVCASWIAADGATRLYARSNTVRLNTVFEDNPEDSYSIAMLLEMAASLPIEGFYKPNDVVPLKLTLTNTCSHTFVDMTAADSVLFPSSPLFTLEELAPAQSYTFDYEYHVTDEDAKAGEALGMVTLLSFDDEYQRTRIYTSNEVAIPAGKDKDQNKKSLVPPETLKAVQGFIAAMIK